MINVIFVISIDEKSDRSHVQPVNAVWGRVVSVTQQTLKTFCKCVVGGGGGGGECLILS